MSTKANYTILLIDDDEKLAKLLNEYFTKFESNFHLISETLPSLGLKTLKAHQPDLVILDIMLPEMDGFDVCKTIRKESNTPILILTARGDINDRVVGLEMGADDYLPKPFDPRELMVRIKSILSRVAESTAHPEEDTLQFERLTIDKNRHEVKVDNQLVDLTTKEYMLLLLMCEHANEIYSRDDIMNELSGIDSELFSRSVDILVSRLRSKLNPLDYIQTVWGVGYKFSNKL
ncbi:MAG: response regulator transcription factor [Ostreibacterium sp.]